MTLRLLPTSPPGDIRRQQVEFVLIQLVKRHRPK
jgi:hypothetical protein